MGREGGGGEYDGSGTKTRVRQSHSGTKNHLEGLERVIAVCVCVCVCVCKCVCACV
jgi:hypothetical protein